MTGNNRRTRSGNKKLGKAERARVETTTPPQDDSMRPQFCFRHCDRDTKQAWRYAFPGKNGGKQASKVLEFLNDRAKETWENILDEGGPRSKVHHYHGVENIDPKAQKDYERLDIDDLCGGDLFRFRVGKGRRLWGFRTGHIFHVVWWDPDHNVYPMDDGS